MISLFEHDLRANAFHVCREGKPVPTSPDHALKRDPNPKGRVGAKVGTGFPKRSTSTRDQKAIALRFFLKNASGRFFGRENRRQCGLRGRGLQPQKAGPAAKNR
jgi:hypothetical protein